MARSKKTSQEVNAGSMADIAFLLLIFFLMTTTIASDKGLAISLPPKIPPEEQLDIKMQERNIFKILVNSQDAMLVENEPFEDMGQLKERVKEFVLNFGDPDAEAATFYNSLPAQLKALSQQDPESSDYPTKPSVVSIKTDRGTSYEKYIDVLDEVQGAFYEIYAEYLGISVEEARNITEQEPSVYDRYLELKDFIPMNISIAEPTSTTAAGGAQ
jgi:biopolymer transport protein ExbD